VDFSAGSDFAEKSKIVCPYRQIKANPPIAASFGDKVTSDFRRIYE